MLLNKPEKKKFLSMDFAERMIRVEQNVSASFNKIVPYYETEYFKNMSNQDKEDFKKHLQRRKVKRVLGTFLFLIPLFVVAMVNMNFTGNVVTEGLNSNALTFVQILSVATFAMVLIMTVYSILSRRALDRRIANHMKIIDDIILKRDVKKIRNIYK
jgi:uncharacterized membrane protein (DUF485 family)